MAYKIIRRNTKENPCGVEIVAVLDAEEDLPALQGDVPAAPGSFAIVAAPGGKVYSVNASGAWVEV